MWHEARKQEKKIRCMLVDYQRRAQRRKDYYDKIKADPTQFLQLHGRPCKIHLDPAVCIAANSSVTMMPWQGNTDVMIDRFDVRAHLDMIPELQPSNKVQNELSYEERQINYERYRILVQNDFFSIPEGKFLHQINLEEKFGPVLKNVEQEPSKKRATVAIGYNYDDDGVNSDPMVRVEEPKKDSNALNSDEEKDEDSESDIDLDLTVDVSKIETQQANELNTCAHAYGMITNDFFSFLNNDLEEAENMRMVKEQEEEKAMFSGRKSRKERRAFRERTLVGRKLSPPSYAWRKSPSYEDYKALMSSNRSRSKSLSPQNSGKITYITSFGGDEPATTGSNLEKSSNNSTVDKDTKNRRNRSRSLSRGRDDKIRRGRRSRSNSENCRKSGKSRSRSRSRNHTLKSNRGDNSRNDRSYKGSSSRSRSKSQQKTKTPPRISPKNSPKDNSTPSGSGLGFSSNLTEARSIPRYYGRRKVESSSELSLTSDDESSKQSEPSKSKVNQASGPSRVNASIKTNNTDKLTPQERLKRKRQVLLNKQFKADKRAEREKVMKMVQERIDRAEEMKEISIKLRRRQRMLRHNDSPRRNSRSSSKSSSSNEWRSSSRSPYNRRSHRRNDRYRTPSEDSSGDSGRNVRKKARRRRSSYSRSRSRSRGRSSSRTPTRRNRYSEERSIDRRQDDKMLKNIKECDKVSSSRSRRYCTLSEERELARVQLENKSDTSRRRDRDQRSPKRKSNNDNYQEDSTSDRRDRWGSDRYRDDHSRYSSCRSNSRDRYSRRDY